MYFALETPPHPVDLKISFEATAYPSVHQSTVHLKLIVLQRVEKRVQEAPASMNHEPAQARCSMSIVASRFAKCRDSAALREHPGQLAIQGLGRCMSLCKDTMCSGECAEEHDVTSYLSGRQAS